jgi:predicted dehydrogenase
VHAGDLGARCYCVPVIRLGVVGYGYWGPKVASAIAAASPCELVAVCDLDDRRLDSAALRHPEARRTTDVAEVLADPDVDGVVVATPPDTHVALAEAVLGAGRHVLVEKPLAQAVPEAMHLIEEAARRELVLMVDHTYVFSDAVLALTDLVGDGHLGTVRSWSSTRANVADVPGPVTLLWDLAVHDLSIIDHVMPNLLLQVAATEAAPALGIRESRVRLQLAYSDGFDADVTVSWSAPRKLRRATITGSGPTVTYDDLDRVAPLTLRYDDGRTETPMIEGREPLARMVEHFSACITDGITPIVDGAAALRTLVALSAAERSLAAGGAAVRVAAEELHA